MGIGNLEQEVNHPVEELVQCKYLRCKRRGEYVRCYFAFERCDTYQKWKIVLDKYVAKSLRRQYLNRNAQDKREN